MFELARDEQVLFRRIRQDVMTHVGLTVAMSLAEDGKPCVDKCGSPRCLVEARRRDLALGPAALRAIPAQDGHGAIGGGTCTADGLSREVTTPTLGARSTVRAATLLNNVLGIKFTRVTGAQFTADGLVCDVEPTTEIPRCELPKTNATLYRVYLLKESFAAIPDRRQPNVVLAKLEEWMSWATHSGLKPFAKAARTIGRHLDGIVAYVASGLSNARSEGTDGKVRTITRRSYGLHGASSLIALIHLCCSGLALQPVHTWPRFHQT
jgi:Transposase